MTFRLFVFGVLLCLCGRAFASYPSVDASYGGFTGHAEVTAFSGTNATIAFRFTASTSESEVGCEIVEYDGAGAFVAYRWSGYTNPVQGASSATAVVALATPPNKLFFTSYTGHTTGGAWSYTALAKGQEITYTATYKITFTMPANTTDHVVSYKFMQDGEVVGTGSQLPHAPAQDVTVDGLETADEVTMVEYQQIYNIVTVDGVGHLVPTGETSVRQAGSGIPTLAGSTGTNSGGGPGGNAPPVISAPPVTPDAPSVNPRPPTPGPPPADHKNPPNIPSGDGGASTADIQKQTNDIIDGLNKVIDNEHGNASAIVDGINDLKASGTDNANSIIAAVNGGKQSTDNAVKGIGIANGYLADISRKLSGGGGDGEATDGGAGDASTAAANAPRYSGAQVGGGMGTGAAVTVPAHDALLPETTLHVGDRDIIIGRMPDFLSSAMDIMVAGRPLLLIALCVWFVHSCSDSVQGYVQGLAQAGTGGMSTVTGALDAVPGASLAKHLASSAAVVAVILAACAAIVALVDVAGARFGLSLSNLFNALDLTSLGPGIGWLDHYVPVGASISFCILRAGMPYLAAPLFLAASTTARFLHL